MLGANASAAVQQQDRPAQSDSGQSIPDAPQPQKKPASKQPVAPPSSSDSSSPPSQPPDKTAPEPPDKTTPQPPATKDENAFPEAVSRDAAKAAGNGSATGDSGSTGKSESPAAGSTKHPSADDNPFPESVSRDAAKAAGDSSDSDTESNPKTGPKNDLPPGVSSSQSADYEPGAAKVTDPVLAKKDTSVGGYYLQTGNYQGALLRYKEAMASDPANVDAIFGVAEAQRLLKQNAEAARNYQLYLDILPNGPKAKQALRALKVLGAGK
jgi:tetratricopeptide (TPR) repeat protein